MDEPDIAPPSSGIDADEHATCTNPVITCLSRSIELSATVVNALTPVVELAGQVLSLFVQSQRSLEVSLIQAPLKLHANLQ